MKPRNTTTATAALCLGLLSGCAVADPDVDSFRTTARVTSIETYHSTALQCLGMLIDQASNRPLDVVVELIPDRTVPPDFRQRGLSRGGEWWIRTALKRLGSERVRVLLEYDSLRGRGPSGAELMVFSGAWTQLDRGGAERDADIQINIGDVFFSIGGDQAYDLIAGDFTTSIDGVLVHASGVGLVVRSSTGEADLLIDNGGDAGAISIGGTNVEGPQMAQRQITEAAVMVHLADYYSLDFRPCLEAGWADPRISRSLAADYKAMTAGDRAASFQRLLHKLGYYEAAIDGLWGKRSQAALMAFEADNRLPITGEPSLSVYLVLNSAERRVTAALRTDP